MALSALTSVVQLAVTGWTNTHASSAAVTAGVADVGCINAFNFYCKSNDDCCPGRKCTFDGSLRFCDVSDCFECKEDNDCRSLSCVESATGLRCESKGSK